MSAYAISNAIPPDYMLLCSPLGVISPSLFEVLNENIMNRLGVEITALHVGNQIIDSSQMEVTDKISFVYSTQCENQKHIKKLKDEGVKAENFTNIEKLHNFLNELSNNIFGLRYGVL